MAKTPPRAYTVGMATGAEAPRTEVELQALLSALSATGGAAPLWLRGELNTAPLPRPASAPDPDAYRGHMLGAISFGVLLLACLGCIELAGDVAFEPAKAAVRAAAVDPDAQDAIALVQGWHAAGDDKEVLTRLGTVVRNPSYARAWSAEKTEGDSYLVLFREPAGAPVYAFEVNLESEAVEPSPEAVERLTMLRVREATESPDALVARAP